MPNQDSEEIETNSDNTTYCSTHFIKNIPSDMGTWRRHRYIIFEEPQEDGKINIGLMKELTSSADIIKFDAKSFPGLNYLTDIFYKGRHTKIGKIYYPIDISKELTSKGKDIKCIEYKN